MKASIYSLSILFATTLSACDFPRPSTAPDASGPTVPLLVATSSPDVSGTAGTTLQDPVVVTAMLDGAPVSGVHVVFTVVDGDIQLSAQTVDSGPNGTAATTLSLGPTVFDGELTAQIAGGTGNPVSFHVHAVAGSPAQLAIVQSEDSGLAGSQFNLVVRAEDANSNPVANVPISFAVTTGGGSVTSAARMTDNTGEASALVALDTVAGLNVVTVTSPQLTPVTASVEGNIGPASRIVVSSGDGQSDVVGAQLQSPLVARVTDAVGNGVPNIDVTFSVASGDGQLGSSGVAMMTVATDVSGEAQATLTLGNSPGTTKVSATTPSVGGQTAQFSETATPGTVAQLVITAGDNQSATVNSNPSSALVVTARDGLGNPAPGVAVAFAVASGGSSIVSSSGATDSAGRSSAVIKLATVAGVTKITASASGLPPVTFSETGTAGAVAKVIATTGNGGTSTVASSTSLVATIEDGFGNPVAGAQVSFAATSGGGSVSPATAMSDVNGQARTTATLGGATGSNTFTASASGASPATFVETGTAGAPASMSGGGSLGGFEVGTSVNASVTVRDSHGNVVPNINVVFAVTGGGGSVTLNATTNAGGNATATWSLGASPGTNTMTATAGSASVVFTATGGSGPPAEIAVAGPSGTTTVDACPQFFTLLDTAVTDSHGIPVAGTGVDYTVESGSGACVAPNTGSGGCGMTVHTTTDSNGLATVKAWVVSSTIKADISSDPSAALTFTIVPNNGACK